MPELPGVLGDLVVEGPPVWQAVFWIGVTLNVIAGLWLLVRAFEKGVAWGIAVLFPGFALIFAVKHWQAARGPLAVGVIAIALVLVPQRFADSDPGEVGSADQEYRVYGPDRPIYQYIDDHGRVKLVDDPSKVPPRHRAKLERIDNR